MNRYAGACYISTSAPHPTPADPGPLPYSSNGEEVEKKIEETKHPLRRPLPLYWRRQLSLPPWSQSQSTDPRRYNPLSSRKFGTWFSLPRPFPPARPLRETPRTGSRPCREIAGEWEVNRTSLRAPPSLDLVGEALSRVHVGMRDRIVVSF